MSHITTKEFADANLIKGTFARMFYYADGRSTPSFTVIRSFMNHLGEHRDPLPTGEVLYRMNCLVGRQAAAEGDFDINIIAPKGGG